MFETIDQVRRVISMTTPIIHRKFFFDSVRSTLFHERLTQSQVLGLTAILDTWEAHHYHWDRRWLAYALGTAHHETDATLQPIREYGSPQYFRYNYDVTGRDPGRARRMGNTDPGDGVKYPGRGLVQLTWKNNYILMDDYLKSRYPNDNVDLVNNPDQAMIPKYAIEIMFYGMFKGSFTGKRFSDYFSVKEEGGILKDDWYNARRIINGTDKANLVANYAKRYYGAISII